MGVVLPKSRWFPPMRLKKWCPTVAISTSYTTLTCTYILPNRVAASQLAVSWKLDGSRTQAWNGLKSLPMFQPDRCSPLPWEDQSILESQKHIREPINCRTIIIYSSPIVQYCCLLPLCNSNNNNNIKYLLFWSYSLYWTAGDQCQICSQGHHCFGLTHSRMQ